MIHLPCVVTVVLVAVGTWAVAGQRAHYFEKLWAEACADLQAASLELCQAQGRIDSARNGYAALVDFYRSGERIGPHQLKVLGISLGCDGEGQGTR